MQKIKFIMATIKILRLFVAKQARELAEDHRSAKSYVACCFYCIIYCFNFCVIHIAIHMRSRHSV